MCSKPIDLDAFRACQKAFDVSLILSDLKGSSAHCRALFCQYLEQLEPGIIETIFGEYDKKD